MTALWGRLIWFLEAANELIVFRGIAPSTASAKCGGAADNCGTPGGDKLVIVGDNFGNEQSKVSVAIAGDKACAVTSLVDHHTVECTTPEYTGWSTSSVVVTAGGQSSSSAFSIKYRGEGTAEEARVWHTRRGRLMRGLWTAPSCLRSTVDYHCELQRWHLLDRGVDADCCRDRPWQRGRHGRGDQRWLRAAEPGIVHAHWPHAAVVHGDAGERHEYRGGGDAARWADR